MFNGKIHSKWPCSIAMWLFTRPGKIHALYVWPYGHTYKRSTVGTSLWQGVQVRGQLRHCLRGCWVIWICYHHYYDYYVHTISDTYLIYIYMCYMSDIYMIMFIIMILIQYYYYYILLLFIMIYHYYYYYYYV